MVECFSCKSALNGNWAINTSGYVNGAYLGVDAYFAYNAVNWVYCFCHTCYSNGTYANLLKSWYSVPINQILAPERLQITNLQTSLGEQQSKVTTLQSLNKDLAAKVAQLEKRIQSNQTSFDQLTNNFKKIEKINANLLSIFPQQYYDKLMKVQQYYQELKLFSAQLHQVFAQVHGKILNKNIQNFKQILGQSLNEIMKMIQQKLVSFKSDNDKISLIKTQTINKMKESKSQLTQKVLFLDEDLQKLSQFFDSKIQKKESQSKNLIQFLNKAQLLKQDLYQ